MPAGHSALWAIVMNTDHLRIVRDLHTRPDRDAPAAPPDEITFSGDIGQLRDIMADKPGRGFASTGGGRRSAMEYSSDPIAEATRAMLRDAIAVLEVQHRKGAFARLAVFAEHSALGEWRKLLPPSLAALVTHEVAANHMKLSPHDLRRKLTTELTKPQS